MSAGFPLASLAEGVAVVDEHGRLWPQNAPMRSLLAALEAVGNPCDSLPGLGLAGDQHAALLAGEAVSVEVAGQHHELRLVSPGDGTWLLSRDTSSAERLASKTLELARVRALADLASILVHDFSNLLGAGLGLASLLRPLVREPAERQILDDLQLGTQQGVALARALARSLQSEAARVVVEAGSLVEQALAVAGKSAARSGVTLTSQVPTTLPSVRVVPAEASQALLQGIMFLLAARPVQLDVQVGVVEQAVAGGRPRRCVRVRLAATPLEAGFLGEAKRAGGQVPGWLAGAETRSASLADLPSAVLAMRRVGGDLCIESRPDGVCFDYVWPAVRSG